MGVLSKQIKRLSLYEKFVRYIAAKSDNRRVEHLNTVVKRLNGDVKHASRKPI